MSLTFRDHRFEPAKNSIDECKERDFTYSAPLFVTAEFTNNETGEIKSQTVFMGDFPLMTDKGTFIINGTERVVVSQLVRSPGVYFDKTIDKTSDKDIYSSKVIPQRGAWLEFEIDKRDAVGVRIDRKRKQSVTVLLKALGWDDAPHPRGVRAVRVDDGRPWTRTTPVPRTRRCSTSTASCARASRRPVRPRRPCWTTCTSTPSATTWPRSGATRSTRSWRSAAASTRACSPRRTSSRRSSTSSHCTPARPRSRAAAAMRGSRSTTSTTSATAVCAPWASSSRTRSVPVWPAWSASSASA